MMHGHEKSRRGHSSCEADEQSRAICCGVGGAAPCCFAALQEFRSWHYPAVRRDAAGRPLLKVLPT